MALLDKFRLDGQVALITGAGKGIGAAIARAFAEAGADVVLGARTEADLQQVAADVEAFDAADSLPGAVKPVARAGYHREYDQVVHRISSELKPFFDCGDDASLA